MSRIGRAPITIPAGVDVKVEEGNIVTVKGPKGELTQALSPAMKIEVEGAEIKISRPNDEAQNRSLHGLTRTLLNNMVVGVTEGFSKTLEISGVAYSAAREGSSLSLKIGTSHPVLIPDTEDVTTECPTPTQIIVRGIDKQKVGQFAAEIRSRRPVEPYKGKGIRYADEVVIRKEGKSGAK